MAAVKRTRKTTSARRARREPRRIAAVFGAALQAEAIARTYSGIRQYALHAGWHFEHVPFLAERLAEGARLDGAVGVLDPKDIRLAASRGIPVVNAWHGTPDHSGLPRVDTDVVESGRVIARHLLARGFRRFGQLVRGRARHLADIRRGFVEEIRRQNRELELSVCKLPMRMYEQGRQWRVGTRILDEWIDSWQTPIAVFCYDVTHLNILAERCRIVHGLNIPRDLGLVCATVQTLTDYYPMLKITGMRSNYEQVGYEAAALLKRLMNGGKPPKKPILVKPGEIIMRESTDVTAVDDPVVAAAMHFMADHCHTKIQVADVARAAAVGRRTLELRFRDTIGISIADQLEYMRVERAKRLLVESDEPVKAIARQCGYSGDQQLCRAFLRREHMTPTAYRARSAAKRR